MRVHSHYSKNRFMIEFVFNQTEIATLYGGDEPNGRYLALSGSWNNGILFKRPEDTIAGECWSKNKLFKATVGTYRIQVTGGFIPNSPVKPFITIITDGSKVDNGMLFRFPEVVFKAPKPVTLDVPPRVKNKVKSKPKSNHIANAVKQLNEFLTANPDVFVSVEGKIGKSVKLVKRSFVEI